MLLLQSVYKCCFPGHIKHTEQERRKSSSFKNSLMPYAAQWLMARLKHYAHDRDKAASCDTAQRHVMPFRPIVAAFAPLNHPSFEHDHTHLALIDHESLTIDLPEESRSSSEGGDVMRSGQVSRKGQGMPHLKLFNDPCCFCSKALKWTSSSLGNASFHVFSCGQHSTQAPFMPENACKLPV